MYTPVDALLLTRAGKVVLRGDAGACPEAWLQGLDAELADLGFVLSHRARRGLAALSPDALAEARAWLLARLAASLGADQRHEPLFRRFPHDVPADTRGLWWDKVIARYLQEPGQPCLLCDGVGTTHVLSPCGHVVCDRCFDGSSYSACPACERPVDRGSPFFLPSVPPVQVASPVPLRRLDLAGDPADEARALLVSLATRAQAMSPTDVIALTTIVSQYGVGALPWLPAKIPVRQNVAHVFGTLLRTLPPVPTLAAATAHLRTATDLLRVIAVWGGAQPGLEATSRNVPVRVGDMKRWKGAPARMAELGVGALHPWMQEEARRHPEYVPHWLVTPVMSARFKPPKMTRAARRWVLAWLEGLPAEALAEDLARHPSAWIRVAEALHPGEYAARHPRVATAFAGLRRGEPVPSFAAVAERLRAAGDVAALVAHLRARPGELWRRADDTLRDTADPAPVLAALVDTVGAVPVPLLLQVGTHLRARDGRAPVRVWFPAGPQFLAPSAPDRRPPLPPNDNLRRAIDAELLARFARLPRFGGAVLDEAVARVVVPFNERTAARAAVALPRGSTVDVPPGDLVRLFLHWCEPDGGQTTDIDLSVAFYDAAWRFTGVCSYYSLNLQPVAVHSGDFQGAPPPDGASEFVDVDRAAALAAGHRHAVMVVNAYAGLPFGKLARGFAGVMRRTGSEGPAFDPKTVELRFDIAGDQHGVYAPLTLDLATGAIGWLDVCGKGELAMNNVETSTAAITRIVPALLAYFASGARPSMLDLGRLHAAARADTVWVRGDNVRRFDRRPGEDALAFLERLRLGDADGAGPLALDGPALALLLRGDLALPPGSAAWALFRDQLVGPLAASDLLTVPTA